MTTTETRAFNAGVAAMIRIATEAAGVLARDPRQTHVGFAREALQAVAEEGAALLLPMDRDPPPAAAAAGAPTPKHPAPAGQLAEA